MISCAIGKYKISEAYAVGKIPEMDLSECLMVACHNFDLDAAKAAGYKRASEEVPKDRPIPSRTRSMDIIDTFPELAEAVGTAKSYASTVTARRSRAERSGRERLGSRWCSAAMVRSALPHDVRARRQETPYPVDR